MQILYISHKYPPSVGGMEKQSFELITRSQKYVNVHSLLWNKGQEPKWKYFLELKKRIKDILDDNPYIDVIHLNDGLMAMACRWLPSYTSIPVIVTLHGLDVVYPLPLFQMKVKEYYSRFSLLITVSESTRSELITRGLQPEKIITIHNGVDLEFNDSLSSNTIKEYIGAQEKDAFILLTVGRQVKRKGFSWFLKNVMPHLNDRVILLMIGPRQRSNIILRYIRKLLPFRIRSYVDLLLGYPSDQDEVDKILLSEGFDHRVFQLSNCSNDDLMNIMRESHLMVMPNIKVEGDAEGFGLVALEASISGTPVIAADIEGIKDAVKNEHNGWLLPSGDSSAWINKINNLIEERDLIDTMGTRAYNHTFRTYSWDKMVIEYLESFERLTVRTGIRKYNYRLRPNSIGV